MRRKPRPRMEVYTRYRFAGSDAWDIPTLPAVPVGATPRWLMPYSVDPQQMDLTGVAAHFFLHDYRFESVWNEPLKSLPRILRFATVLSPDYSVYRHAPRIQQFWNVYRNRWCGAFWASRGVQVIPSIAWSDADSFEFAFIGVARHSLVAVSTLGVNLEDEYLYGMFSTGFREMLCRLDPSRVLCYGGIPDDFHAWVEIYTYPTHWKGIVSARRRGLPRPDARRLVQRTLRTGSEGA